MPSRTPSPGRPAEAAVWIAGPPALVILCAAVPALLDPRAFHPVEHTVAGAAATLAAVLLAWHLVSLAAARLALLPVLPGLVRRALARSVARLGTGQARRVLARRGVVVSLGVGLAVGGLAPAALADPAPPPDDLSWGALAVSGERSSSAGTPAQAPPAILEEAALLLATRAAPPPTAPRPPTHVVRPGESLWSIAADLAGPRADDAAIARLWPLLHRTNRSVIGADPGVILPGQVLVLPEVLP